MDTQCIRSGKLFAAIKVALIALLALIFVAALSSCQAKAQVLSAEYMGGDLYVGDSVDENDVRVVASYSDGTVRRVDKFALQYDFSVSGERDITVTYADNGVVVSTSVKVRVKDKTDERKAVAMLVTCNVNAIELNGLLNKNNLAVTVTYSAGQPKQVGDYELTYDFSSVGKKTVKVKYIENDVVLTSEFEITVTDYPERLVLLEAEYSGGAIYTDGALNKSDIKVTAFYANGEPREITSFTADYDSSASGEMKVAVSYTDNGVTKTAELTVTVIDPVLTGISVTYNGTQVKLGSNIVASNFTVVAQYDGNVSKKVTNFNVGGFSSQALGAQLVEISYTECGVTKTATAYVTVVDEVAVNNSNFSVHFLELGNANSGDCVYIKAGDTDVLIDAGSRKNSAPTLINYLSKYVADGKFEYVIVTHAHQDHITGFLGESGKQGVFDAFKCDTIIDFPKTGKKLTTASNKDSTYGEYVKKRDAQVENGAKHYTALDCVNNADGAKKVYNLVDDGSITMEILYQDFYEKTTSNENNYSVCLMITQGENHYLFTGDLEDDGETSLVKNNPELPKMTLYKGGHHGSYTAASEVLMEKIQPQYVCICTCAGNVEYTQDLNHAFPAQEFIDRIAPYTDKVYVTTLGKIALTDPTQKWDKDNNKWKNNGYESMNGNIVFSCKDGEITVQGSNNNLKLKETEWFQKYREKPDAWE